MRLTREYRIREITASGISNAPFRIELSGSLIGRRGEGPFLTLDQSSCDRFGITKSLNLLGRTLQCVMESHELPLKGGVGPLVRFVDTTAISKDDLLIRVLREIEDVLPNDFRSSPSMKRIEVSRILELSSFESGDAFHPHPKTCPFYHLSLALTKDEYDACKALSPTSVFRVEFHLYG